MRKLGYCILVIGYFLTSLSSVVHAYSIPGAPLGYVSDFAGVLSPATIQSLDAKLDAIKRSTGDEIAVVTVKSLEGDTVENYAVKLFQQWGIGTKEHDNGILILVAPAEHDVRIEVGYGLEGTLTDVQSGRIIRNVMIPEFKNNDYDAGVSKGTDAVISIITHSPDAAQYAELQNTQYDPSFLENHWEALFFFGLILLNFFARILGRTTSWWLGGVLGAGIGVITGMILGFIPIGISAILILTPLGLLFDYIVSKRPPGGGGGGIWPIFFGGRGGSGNNSNSGFGGFGGGSSGGGGASGHW